MCAASSGGALPSARGLLRELTPEISVQPMNRMPLGARHGTCHRLCRQGPVSGHDPFLPPIIVASVVGIVLSLIQAITQLQEQTLAFGVKLLAVGLTLFLMGKWLSGGRYCSAARTSSTVSTCSERQARMLTAGWTAPRTRMEQDRHGFFRNFCRNSGSTDISRPCCWACRASSPWSPWRLFRLRGGDGPIRLLLVLALYLPLHPVIVSHLTEDMTLSAALSLAVGGDGWPCSCSRRPCSA